jgi:bacillithiol biosynthesis cysteine-adding enzyme BshC
MTAPLAHLDGLGGGRPMVVTGQQAGLFGGPLFTLVKLLGAVKLARSEGCVPCFWIECEDADIREADQATVLDREGVPRRLTLEEPDDGRPVRARTLGARVSELTEGLEEILPPGERTATALASLRAAWAPGTPWALAFERYLASLVEGLGVVFLDPSAAEVKAASAPIFRQVIERAPEVLQALAEGSRAEADPQVPFLPGELPLFLIDEGGRRSKLVVDGDGFALKGGSRRSRAELDDLLAKEPARFSAAVLLRPVLQDSLLPTRAYVAGPSEARYHRQLGPLYRLLGVVQPEVLPRPRVTLLDPRARRALERLGIGRQDPLTGLERAAAAAAARRAGVDPRAEAAAALAQASAALAALGARLGPLDPSLDKPLAEAQASLKHHLERLGNRAAQSLERRDEELRTALERLRALLEPLGQPQERVLAPLAFLTRVEAPTLAALILDAIDPADPGKALVLDLP